MDHEFKAKLDRKSRRKRLLEAVNGRSRTPFGDQDLGRIRSTWIEVIDAVPATPFVKQQAQCNEIRGADRILVFPNNSPHHVLRSACDSRHCDISTEAT
ncbi:hypothetical protein ACK9YZ_29520 [Rhizobium sp. ZK1]|uniref:hypothetical protein n=1 Tax=Rhizobium sp. ZK1 TaxID=3389872 RepID=UPI0039F6D4B6